MDLAKEIIESCKQLAEFSNESSWYHRMLESKHSAETYIASEGLLYSELFTITYKPLGIYEIFKANLEYLKGLLLIKKNNPSLLTETKGTEPPLVLFKET